jgi:hypothetical protein
MRALCGAIITAGALLGLGLTSIGFGTRYAHVAVYNQSTEHLEAAQLQQWWKLDISLLFILVFLTLMAIIGLGIAFVGLAYHHHRRHHEMLHAQAAAGHHGPRIEVPGSAVTTGVHQ